MEIETFMIPWIVGVAVAIFALGYAIGHELGKRDGEATVAEYYEGRRRRK